MDGRTTEIQRLIGRSLRAAIDLDKLGERLITVDCDVLLADGGTRTASITGGWVALADAIASIEDDEGNKCYTSAKDNPLTQSVAAISAGIVKGVAVVDLDYPEDSTAEVDMNLIMAGNGEFIEVQGGGEGTTFSADQLSDLIKLGTQAVVELTNTQRQALGKEWPVE